jgi:hypothetical protein
VSRLSAHAPQPARRHLDERQQKVHGRSKCFGIVTWPSLFQQRSQLRRSARALINELPTDLDQLLHLHAGEPADVGGHANVTARTPEDAFENGAHHRPEQECIASSDQMNGRAHQPHAHGATLGDEACEVVRAKVLQARPKSDVGIDRLLRLHTDKLFDRVLCRHPRASEQELPREQSTIERTATEDHDAGIVEREIRTGGTRWTAARAPR